jgi:hypothetical protein
LDGNIRLPEDGDEAAERWVQFRSAASDVDQTAGKFVSQTEDSHHDRPTHQLGALRRGLDMAMPALQVAAQTEIGLNRRNFLGAQHFTLDLADRLVKTVHNHPRREPIP